MIAKTKIILLSGFLGSGKTTLLKHIISLDADMSDTVIIMNEIGDVGIDGMFLKDLGSDMVELTSGCICCSMSDDLQETIEEILQRFAPRYILIEATGVADPRQVSAVIDNSDFKDNVDIHKILTVMDAECWQVRDVFGTLFFRQLKQADTIILNKIDLLKKDDIPEYLLEIHQEIPHAQVIPAVNCRIDPEVVWFKSEQQDVHKNASGESRHQQGTEVGPIRQYGKIYTDTDFVTFSFSESIPLDEPAFIQFVQDMPKELFRLKGTVHYGDRTMMINSVGGKTEWGLWDGTAETRLAFVGWNIIPDDFLTKLKACIRY